MSLEVAYALKKKQMAKGGLCMHGKDNCEMCHGGQMAEGGMIDRDESADMVDRIMKKRHYSKGGQVANDTPIKAGFEENQFDDLVKRDELEFAYTGKNSGDELGNAQEDEDRRDMISRIMASRRLKDKMPRPS